ncbi:MAG TPA: SPOR domain-containing protein, partial [Chroococcidiopsis sp.]
QTALSSLDVKLTDELARYRRMRGRYPRQTPPAQPKESDRQPDLAAATAAAVTAAAAATAATATTRAQSAASYGAMHEGSGAIADGVSPAIPPLGVGQTPLAEPLAGPDLSKMGHEFHPHVDDAVSPDGYLESSEELLKSLSEEEAQLRAEEDPGLLQTLLTPLGIGSMLLLLLSSVTFGYLLTNPDSFKRLGLDRLLGQGASPEVSVSPVASPETSPLPAGPDLTNQEFVDLNLETLSRVPSGVSGGASEGVTVPADPTAVNPTAVNSTAVNPATGAPSAAASPASGARPATENASSPSSSSTRDRSDTAAAPRRATPPRTVTTEPVTPAPAPPRRTTPPRAANPQPSVRPAAPAAPATPVAAAPSSAPVQQSLYYVVTNYSGDRSLDQARSAVGDAYVRNYPNGARVQMGAFSERSRAEELRQQLQQQGIQAEIYRP